MSQTNVREIPTTDGKGLKSFVALERRWVGTNPQYVSEIDADVIKGLSGREGEPVRFRSTWAGNDLQIRANLSRRFASVIKLGQIDA